MMHDRMMVLGDEIEQLSRSIGQVRMALSGMLYRIQQLERDNGPRVVTPDQHALDLQTRQFIGSCQGLPYIVTATPVSRFEGDEYAKSE